MSSGFMDTDVCHNEIRCVPTTINEIRCCLRYLQLVRVRARFHFVSLNYAVAVRHCLPSSANRTRANK
eukprot:COSAG01_NODE_1301_length_10829_cov_20.185182_3_plen_68_part_00